MSLDSFVVPIGSAREGRGEVGGSHRDSAGSWGHSYLTTDTSTVKEIDAGVSK